MSKKKDTFIFQKSWSEAIKKRSPQVQLEVYNAIVLYASEGIIPEMSEVAEAVFDFIKNDIDKNNAKYEEVCKKRSEAGKTSMKNRYKDKCGKELQQEETNGEVDNNSQQTVTNPTNVNKCYQMLTNDNKTNKCYQTVTNVTDYDNDYDNNDYHNQKETISKEIVKKEDELLSSPSPVLCDDLNKEDSVLFEEVEEVGLLDNSLVVQHKPFRDYEGVKDMFNSICVCLPKITVMTPKRKEKVRLRLKEMGEDLSALKAFFVKVNESQFLNGNNNRGWKADFDWLFSSGDKWISIMEGKYNSGYPAREEKKSELQKNMEVLDSLGVKKENIIF